MDTNDLTRKAVILAGGDGITDEQFLDSYVALLRMFNGLGLSTGMKVVDEPEPMILLPYWRLSIDGADVDPASVDRFAAAVLDHAGVPEQVAARIAASVGMAPAGIKLKAPFFEYPFTRPVLAAMCRNDELRRFWLDAIEQEGRASE